MSFTSGDADDINASTTKETGALLGAIADLKGDNKALRADNASLREAAAGDPGQHGGHRGPGGQDPPHTRAAATGHPAAATVHPPSPDGMEMGEDPTAPGGTKRRREQASGLHSPPATPRKPKAVKITSPPPTLMHFRHAAVERSPPPRTVERTARREDSNMGWTAVARKRHGGGAKSVERGNSGEERGTATFWATYEGLRVDWRPVGGRHGKRGKAGGKKAKAERVLRRAQGARVRGLRGEREGFGRGIRLHASGGGDGGRGRLRGRWNRAADRRGVLGGRMVAEKADRSRGGGFLSFSLGALYLLFPFCFISHWVRTGLRGDEEATL